MTYSVYSLVTVTVTIIIAITVRSCSGNERCRKFYQKEANLYNDRYDKFEEEIQKYDSTSTATNDNIC